MKLTPKRKEVIAEARSWIGTKFGPGSIKGVNCSCVSLIIEVLSNCGFSKDVEGLRKPFLGLIRPTHYYQLLQEFNKCFPNRTNITQVLPGDFIIFQTYEGPKHVAFASESGNIIHSHADYGKVVEHLRLKAWTPVMVYKLPGE